VQLINHESHNSVALLGHHANAIALPQAANEIVFLPGEFKALRLDVEYLGHIATNHPPDVNANYWGSLDSHDGLLPNQPNNRHLG
jgi:hypothetical protein